MQKANLIFLTGFSAAGKSTIGPILANSLGFDFIDIDKLIVEREQKSINEIFAEKGEAYFRQLEQEILASIADKENLVVSLGGGTLENDASFDIVRNSGTMVYLKSDVNALARRLSNKDDRPLLKGENGRRLAPDEIKKRIETLISRREERYAQAPISVQTDQTPLGKTVDKLQREIERYLKSRQNS
ncbi:MAG: shikimate kinase [Chloroherpetonaceae bacterium]|nr:shikimate kinase [Chloroherpetonaceae bacterium]MDW8436733.1 shikimate kinase [Chloroherpetonaceae bacterium]